MRLYIVNKYWLFFVIAFSTVPSLTSEKNPSFSSQEGFHQIHVGKTVELPCRVSNLGDYTVIWSKADDRDKRADGRGNNPIFVAKEVMVSDDRVQLVDEESSFIWDLRINKVEANDEGVYLCQISKPDSELTQQQTLSVLVPPSVHIAPEKSPYTVRVGQSIQLTCFPSGNPQATVIWTKIVTDGSRSQYPVWERRRPGSLLPDGSLAYDGETLHVDYVTPQHEGVYRCTGRNDVGESHAEINVHVTYPPKIINPGNKIIFVTVDDAFNISCSYTGNPAPSVEWIFNGFRLELNAKDKGDRMRITETISSNYTTSTLFVEKVLLSEFGDYSCRVASNIGRDEATTHVSGLPGPAQISIRPEGPELSWTMESPAPILEYRVEYRTNSQDHFSHISVPVVKDKQTQKSLVYHGGYTFSNLQPNQNYEINVRGRNTYGWGISPMKSVFFKTEKTAVQKPPNVKDEETVKKSSSRKFLSGLLVFLPIFSIFS